MPKNKVTFGLKKAVAFPILSEDASTGEPTYGTKIELPGAKELKLDFQGDIQKFYADDTVYYQILTQAGEYQGDFVSLGLPEEFYTQILMQVKNHDGVIMENSSQEPREFALLFECSGDAQNTRYAFLKCKPTKPTVGGATTEEQKTPEEKTITISAVPRLDNNIVKVWANQDSAAYANWYNSVYEFVADTYDVVQSPTGNPSTSGYYEQVNGVYVPSADTAVDQNKTYYTVHTT